MSIIDKKKLRDVLLTIEAASIQEATLLYESHLQGARTDLSESDDQGQRSQTNKMVSKRNDLKNSLTCTKATGR